MSSALPTELHGRTRYPLNYEAVEKNERQRSKARENHFEIILVIFGSVQN